MKIKLKNIDLKKMTLEDIDNNTKNLDINKFVNYITERLNNANKLLDVKMEKLSAIELYNGLKMVFDILVDEKDYLRALSKKYGKHYTQFINISTNMLDGDGNNIEYIGAVVPEVTYYDGNRLDLKTIRKMTKKNDFLIVKEIKTKDNVVHVEKYENYKFVDIDIDDKKLNEESELFLYLVELLKKDILVKNILYALKLYINELLYQAKCITSLSQIKDNPELAQIGKKYEEAFNKIFNDGSSQKKRKISVPRHKKMKY